MGNSRLKMKIQNFALGLFAVGFSNTIFPLEPGCDQVQKVTVRPKKPEVVTPLVIGASCDSAWNSVVLSGTFEPVASFNGRVIYEKQTPDLNRNYWTIWFDTVTDRWVFSYQNDQIPGGRNWREYGSTIKALTSNTPGYKSTDVVNYAGCIFNISGQEALVFTEWSDWSACSKTCEEGIQTRSRSCTGQCAIVNSSELTDTKSCNWECALPPPILEISSHCASDWDS